MRLNVRSGSRRSKAFTLLEVLVVIGIIAILMSIAMPIGRRAKEEGRRVVCLSNIGELGMAWNLYAAENKDMLCSAMTHFNDRTKSSEYELDGNTFNNWVADGPGLPYNGVANTEQALTDGVLWKYNEVPDLYKCATDRRGLVRSYAISHTMGCDTSYGGTNYRAMPLTTRHSGGSNMCFADMHCETWKWEDKATLDFADGMISFDEFQAGSSVNKDLDRLKRLIVGM